MVLSKVSQRLAQGSLTLVKLATSSSSSGSSKSSPIDLSCGTKRPRSDLETDVPPPLRRFRERAASKQFTVVVGPNRHTMGLVSDSARRYHLVFSSFPPSDENVLVCVACTMVSGPRSVHTVSGRVAFTYHHRDASIQGAVIPLPVFKALALEFDYVPGVASGLPV